MNLNLVLILSGGVTLFVIIIILVTALLVANFNIFKGSGSPIAMAQMILSSIHITTQHLLGILIITIISLLIVNEIIESKEGLPIISLVAGYLLGKSFKDVSFSHTQKNQSNRDN